MKKLSACCVLAMTVGLMHFASGSTNAFRAVTSGGLSGADWLQYADAANWVNLELGCPQDDARGIGNAVLDNCGTTGNGHYIELPASLAVHRMVCKTGNPETYPVLRGDGTLTYTFTTSNDSMTDMGGVWLYSPYFLVGTSGYGGFISTPIEICGPLVGTSFSGSAGQTAESGWTHGPRLATKVVFDYGKFATERIGADGVRTVDDWTCDYHLEQRSEVAFVSPCGADEDVVRTFALTDKSPFARLAAGQANGNLPVGTGVRGTGVDDDTYLKRVFPDGSIELSKPATATVSASELRFEAVTYRTTVVGSGNNRLRVVNQGGVRTVKVNKFRAEDDFEVQVMQLNHYITSGESLTLNIATDDGCVPGRLRIVDDIYKHSSETKANPLTVVLEDCNLVPPARIRNEDATFKSAAGRAARITVDTATVRPAVGSYVMKFVEVKGSLVKDGVGTWNVAFPETVSACSGTVTVEEGTLLVANANATLGTVEVKSGATLDVSAGGVSVQNLIAAPGAIVSGGRVTVAEITGDAAKIVLKGGAALIDAMPSADPMTIELQSGSMRRLYEEGASIALVTTNSILRIKGSGLADVLVVGGGGGAGGLTGGGGGGGGGVLYTQKVELVSGYYGVTVGLGGKGAIGRGIARDAAGNCISGSCNGGNSAFNGLVAIGGGAGGGYNGGGTQTHPDSTVASHVGVAGGSGGGGGVLYPADGAVRDQNGGAGTPGQGHAGAKSCIRRYHTPAMAAGGGGGGAGAAAIDAGLNALGQVYGSNGGDGLLVPIWGNRYWGGGGAGSSTSNAVDVLVGGKGGGGDSHVGLYACKNGGDGEVNTGGGGGAAMSQNWDVDGGQRGGNGGSGIVIIRFASKQFAPVVHDDPIATGGHVRRRGGYAIHSFLANGVFTLNESALLDVLVVGGGGGGGVSGGGGGGGGGVQFASNVWVEAGAYAVTVGKGGTGQTSTAAADYPTAGTCSSVDFGSFFGFAVPGGGHGGFRRFLPPSNDGGAGGGGGAPYGASHADPSAWDPFIAGASGVSPFGHNGGMSTNWIDQTVEGWQNFKRYAVAGGGGGGAGGPGGDAWYEGAPSAGNRAKGGTGGAGVWCDFSGEMVEYGAGGDGGSAALDALGQNTFAGADGVPGTGKGGGGSTQCIDTFKKGGDGGCGCVIIRYPVRPQGMVILVR